MSTPKVYAWGHGAIVLAMSKIQDALTELGKPNEKLEHQVLEWLSEARRNPTQLVRRKAKKIFKTAAKFLKARQNAKVVEEAVWCCEHTGCEKTY